MTDQSPPAQDALPEQLNQILGEWGQLITSLAALIRENVEGLLPAVFGLANLVHRVSEARLETSDSARDAGTSLRDRAQTFRQALAPLSQAHEQAEALSIELGELGEQAAALRARAGLDPEVAAFLDRLATAGGGVLPRARQLIDVSRQVEQGGRNALAMLESHLDTVEQLINEDSSELQEAAARVKHFVESSKQAIDQLILKLQFQDRTDQILSHLQADFESLSQALDEVHDRPFDAEAWREARAKRFTTAEERSKGQQLSTDAGDIELF